MRRTIVMALLGALLFAAPAHAQSNRVEILRDCQEDGKLNGDYSAADLRDARSHQPTEVLEYSDCGDVLTAAIAAKTAGSQDTDNSGAGSGATGGTTGGSSGGNGGGTSSTGTTSDPAATSTPNPGGPDTGQEQPVTPQEWAAINDANKSTDRVVDDLKPMSPGASRLTAQVGRNTMPGLLVVVLALIAAAAVALVVAPVIRRRGLGPTDA